MFSLFHMIELKCGAISIDGIDISTISRNKLRFLLNAIPQEPYFLSGSIRLNADPHGTSSDKDILEALSKVPLREIIETKGGLDTEMSNETLSHGENQLFCLARAILKRSKIVVLDEATSK
jgi:ATP-binding cassette, subfamily C (CFTR/MRP), member 1